MTSSAMTAKAFLTDHIRALSESYDVDLVVNPGASAATLEGIKYSKVHRARIERAIAPGADLRAIVELTRILRAGRYDAVQSITPKAGIVTAIAAWLARVPVRIHIFTGQVWATRRGARRRLLRTIDRIVARLDTHVLVDSASQRDFLRSEYVLWHDEQGEVLANGSVSGVDPTRFRPDPVARAATRTDLDVPPDALLFLFVGRLNRDKGVLELARAFATIAARRTDLYLLIVGPDEEHLADELGQHAGAASSHVRIRGLSDAPEHFMAASDVFCLPSRREGFGAVVIEAAAVGLPAIGTRIYGLTDAIKDNVTGLLVEPENVPALAAAMARLADDVPLRHRLGAAARERALREFPMQLLTNELVRFYERVLPQGT